MTPQQLTLEQLEQLNQISDPAARRRYAVLFQLPPDLQTAFESEATTNSVWGITRDKYDLADGDIGKVARIIGLIFLGEMPIKNFIAELKNKLNLDVATAQAIAQDINQAIFQPVRESLMRVHNITENSKLQNPNYKQTPNTQIQNNQNLKPESRRPQTNTSYEAQQRRDEVLNKIRPAQNPPTARPASYYNAKPRNTVDLRRTKRKSKYNGFFT